MNLRFADFEIDLARQEMRRTGAIVHVEPQVFDLLVHLIRNRDRIVSKDELFEAIWQGRIVSEATLSSRISAARRALGDSGNDQTFIRTLHKRGFRFVGDVECDSAAPAANAIETGIALEEAVHETAKLVPAPASLPTSDEPSQRSRSTTSGAIRTRNTLPMVLPRPWPAGRWLPIGYRTPPTTFRCCTLIRVPPLPPKRKRQHRMGGELHETCSSPAGPLPSFH